MPKSKHEMVKATRKRRANAGLISATVYIKPGCMGELERYIKKIGGEYSPRARKQKAGD